ncbi:MFS-type transporter SLC18B1 [Lamellibrachia satsuma]|nr:MFS-type transporter SLC18B1 [Lamellibrachia satsuma]
MEAEELICSWNEDLQRRDLSSDGIQSGRQIGDYDTFEEELPVDGTKWKNSKLIVFTFCITNFLVGMFFSLMAPFFAIEMTTIGTKLAFVSGLMVSGGSIIGFGWLNAVPSGATYIVMCIVGGFRLPFVSSGASILAVGALAWLLLPPQAEIIQKERKSFWSFVIILPVLLIGFITIVLYGTFGFYDIALAIHLKTNYHATPAMFVSVFFVAGGAYAFTSPVWGVVADKKPQWGPALVIIGSVSRSAAFLLTGPAPFLYIPNHPVWLLYVSVVVLAVTFGFAVVCAQQLFVIATKYGYPDNLDTKGMVSGVFLLFSATGLFLGPIAGGSLSETLGFEWAAAVMCFTGLFAVSLWAVYVPASSCRTDRSSEKQPILMSNPTE